MAIKSDKWIRRQAVENKMIEPFSEKQVRDGVISYGLYLWNLLPGQTWTMIVGSHAGVAGTVLLFAVIFAAVELSYRYVERPVMRWAKARLSGREKRGLVASRRRYGVLGLRQLAREG